VRRVTNNPRINIDANIENYRTWLLESETKLAELSGLTTQLAKELVEAAKTDLAVKIAFSPLFGNPLRR
jgi:ethanolamine ammonia-lyase large subunit